MILRQREAERYKFDLAKAPFFIVTRNCICQSGHLKRYPGLWKRPSSLSRRAFYSISSSLYIHLILQKHHFSTLPLFAFAKQRRPSSSAPRSSWTSSSEIFFVWKVDCQQNMDAHRGSGEPSLGLAMLLNTALAVPVWEYALLVLGLFALSLYYAMDFHLIGDLVSGFRGNSVQLFYNSASEVAVRVLPKCEVLKQRYWATPWLCSPHLQTAFLHFFGRPPQLEYCRQLVCTPDGGTIALDWLNLNDCLRRGTDINRSVNGPVDETPTAVIVPGLTSDSANAYVKHIAHSLAKKGWRVVVANHRGLGGVSITSNQFYNAGWTEDLRRVVNYLHQEYPMAPLLAVGTSIGANILVKYLGEEGGNTPLGGAAAICCPWDLVVCDRFICRGAIQKLYNRVLTLGLRGYAQLHQNVLAHIADWDLINKSRSVRDFDNHCTRFTGQYETVDTYYRKCSSAYFLDTVSIPLFCISSLDDPVCTKEAIPWDECRVNANVILGVTRHGGHLAFFEGLTASSIWWVRAATEFLAILCSSSVLHKTKEVQVPSSGLTSILESSIDKIPCLSIAQNGMVGTEENFLNSVEKAVGLSSDEGDQKEMTLFIKGQEGLQVDTKRFEKSFSEAAPTYRNACNLSTSQEEEENNAVKISSFRAVKTQEDTDSPASSSASSDIVEEPCYHMLKLSIQDHSELLTLESALSQILEQVGSLKHTLQEEKNTPVIAINMQRNVGMPMQVPVSSSVVSTLVKRNKAVDYQDGEDNMAKPAKESKTENIMSKKFVNGVISGPDSVKLGVPVLKGINRLAAQNRRTLWLLAYMAIVTTWPLVGSALFLHGRKRLTNVVTKYWAK